ncbi:UNVERIFIED_ORG: sorbitol/mannitol transport system substrate-binding protein [Arthrobacter sp. UYEF10]
MRNRHTWYSRLGILISIVVVGTTTACGAGSQSPQKSAQSSCDVDAPKAPATVNVLAYSAPGIDPFSEAMVGCSGVENLTVRHSPVDFNGQLTKAPLSLSGNSPSYDIAEVYTSTLLQYAAKGWLQPLDDLISKYGTRYGLDDISPSLLKQFTYNGHVYGLPNQVNVHEMVYRKDIFDKLGLKAPTTFDELVAAAQKIQDAQLVRYPLTMPISAGTYASSDFYSSVASLGGTLTKEGTDEPLLNSPTAETALNSLTRLVPFMSPSAINSDEAAVATALQTGQSAIGLTYSGDMGQLLDSKNTEFADKFAFAPPPAVEKGGRPWGTFFVDGFALAKNSKVDATVLFQIAAVGTGADAAKAAGSLAYPARSSVLNDSTLSKSPATAYWPAVTATIDNGVAGPQQQPYFDDLKTAIRPAIADGIFGKKSVSDALADAQAAATSFLQKR